jgi:hypothetical protein
MLSYFQSFRSRDRPVALTGPLIEIYDANKTQKLGRSFVADSDDETVTEQVVRPILPEEAPLLYHQLWRALLRGFDPFLHPDHPDPERWTSRPALPVELVRLIIRTAALMVPDRQQTHRAGRSILVHVTTRDETPVVSRVWFRTKPLDLAKTAAVQLVTMSRDQGWVSPPTEECHSWFEWGVFNCGIPAQDEGDVTGNDREWRTESAAPMSAAGSVPDSAFVWKRTHGNPVASSLYEQQDGPQVGMDDEMWEAARAGAVIAVRACAQQALWDNDARYGEILVWKWFEPVVCVA